MALEKCCCREVALPLQQRGTCTETNQNFAQLETERLSIPPVLQKQRISSTVWKTVGVARNSKQMIAAGVVNSM